MKQITSVHSISRVCTDGGKTKSRLAVTPASVLPPGSSGWSWPIVVNMEPLRIQIGWILGAPSCLGRRVSGNSLRCLPAGEESLGSLEIRATCVLWGHLPASLWPGFSICSLWVLYWEKLEPVLGHQQTAGTLALSSALSYYRLCIKGHLLPTTSFPYHLTLLPSSVTEHTSQVREPELPPSILLAIFPTPGSYASSPSLNLSLI